MEIPVESIMPPGYTQYLLNVINSNRELKVFHFSQIKDALLSEEHIYQIIEHQMQRLQIEMDDCFENIVLCVDNSEKSMKYDVETKNLFFCICKNENSRFVYVFPDGNRETILVEWNH